MKNKRTLARRSLLTLPTRRWLFSLTLPLLFMLLLAACGTPTPTPFPTLTVEPVLTPTPSPTATAVSLTTYRNDTGLFALELPSTWEVERRGLTSLGEHYQLGPAPVGPGPASSALFIAPADDLAADTAAEMLLCGSGCPEKLTLEETTIAGRPALRTSLDVAGTPLEWFFVEHEGRLIFFTLHDPETLLTRTDLLDTFSFLDPEAVAGASTLAPTGEPTAPSTQTATRPPTTTPTGTPTATPPSTLVSWQTAEVSQAGIAFEIPDGWILQTAGAPWEWAPPDGSAGRIGFGWQPLPPDQALEQLLPSTAEIVASEPLTLTWDEELSGAFTRGISVTLSSDTGWEQHALFQVGLRGYDLYVGAPGRNALETLQPMVARALTSLELQEVQLAIEDPSEAAIIWFQALIEDPSGAAARAYMTPALRAQVPPDASPLALLALPARLAVYNLTWLSGTEQEALLEAELTLLDESVVRRRLTLVRDPVAGWQVNAVTPIPESS